MAESFFFYDLETSGFSPREARIMQFAGQRTDMELNPVNKPSNFLIKLAPDVLPDPGAILVTGITPQKTLEEGLTEAEFLEHFYKEVWQPGTIFVGFNSVRFDDEFMRFLMWRNFRDAYEWQWKDGCSRWDLLDVVRMTRALRPDGINWPVDASGKSTNRLELLTRANNIEHDGAHDALADVRATIDVAKMIKTAQPKLFDWLLSVRGKKSVQQLVDSAKPFVYTSGKYGTANEKTTVVIKLADVTGGALVYDLRFDPSEFMSLKPEELVERWRYTKDETAPARLPVKTIKFNHCPAVAPIGVLDDASWNRINLSLDSVNSNLEKLGDTTGFATALRSALSQMDAQRELRQSSGVEGAEARLYDGFLDAGDKSKLSLARQASEPPDFSDDRLNALWPRFVARNFPSKMSSEQKLAWNQYCRDKLTAGGDKSAFANYFKTIAELGATKLSKSKLSLLEDLQLYGESLISFDD